MRLLKSRNRNVIRALVLVVISALLAISSPLSSNASAPPTFAGHNGAIVFARIIGDRPTQLWRVSPDGSRERPLIRSATVSYATPQVAPNGKSIVFVAGNRQGHIRTMRPDGSSRRKLTHGPGSQLYPQWSPDGRRIAYLRFRDFRTSQRASLMVMAPDGTKKKKLTGASQGLQLGSWAPDGRRLVFSSSQPASPGEGTVIKVVSRSGRVHTVVGPTGRRDVGSPQWSPSGRRIVFISQATEASGRPASRVITIRADGTNRRPIASGDVIKLEPAWSPDGSRIAYLKCRGAQLTCTLWVARANGSNKRQVASKDVQDFAWSPNGKKLLYSWTTEGSTAINMKTRLYVVTSKGSDRHRITDSLHRGQQLDLEPSWQSK
jgi:Tol biopolymer transport system component